MGSVSCFAFIDSMVFAGIQPYYGVYLTTDIGENWNSVNSGLPASTMITQLTTNKSQLIAATSQGLFISTNYGSIWLSRNMGLTNKNVNSVAIIDTNIYVSAGFGIFNSTNNGMTWQSMASDMKKEMFIKFCNNSLFAITRDDTLGTYLYFKDSLGWEAINFSNKKITRVWDLIAKDTCLFVGTNAGVFVSDNKGQSWSEAGIIGNDVVALLSKGSLLFAGTLQKGIYYSKDNAKTWIDIKGGLNNGVIETIGANASTLFVGTDGSIYKRFLSDFENNTVHSQQQIPTITFSPNPTTAIITIQNAELKISHVTVSNMLGEQILELVKPNAPEFTIDLSRFPAGTYLATFATVSGIVTKKIIKE